MLQVMLKLQRVAGCDIAELPQQSNNSKVVIKFNYFISMFIHFLFVPFFPMASVYFKGICLKSTTSWLRWLTGF